MQSLAVRQPTTGHIIWNAATGFPWSCSPKFPLKKTQCILNNKCTPPLMSDTNKPGFEWVLLAGVWRHLVAIIITSSHPPPQATLGLGNVITGVEIQTALIKRTVPCTLAQFFGGIVHHVPCDNSNQTDRVMFDVARKEDVWILSFGQSGSQEHLWDYKVYRLVSQHCQMSDNITFIHETGLSQARNLLLKIMVHKKAKGLAGICLHNLRWIGYREWGIKSSIWKGKFLLVFILDSEAINSKLGHWRGGGIRRKVTEQAGF